MRAIIGFLIFLLFPAMSHCTELLMRTYGNLTIAPSVHGFSRARATYPGYRAEFMTYVDFFRVRGFIFNSLLGTTTIITHPDTSAMRLDRIRYTLAPGFRYEFKTWLVRGTLHHECIHAIGRPEASGSVWWNSLQLGIGTKEAYYLYLKDEYRNRNNVFLNTWDARIDAGYVVPARRTVFSGQNHDYRYEQYSLIRYHVGVFGNWAYFATLRQNMWVRSGGDTEHQINLTLNMFRKGTKNFAGIYYSYTFYDTFSLDNTDRLGFLGFRLLY